MVTRPLDMETLSEIGTELPQVWPPDIAIHREMLPFHPHIENFTESG